MTDPEARPFGFRASSTSGQVAHDLRDALIAQERLRGTPYERELRSPRPIYEISLWLGAAVLMWLIILLCL